MERKYDDSVSMKGGPSLRVSSPRGDSIFQTVAPRSESICVENGPGEHARQVEDLEVSKSLHVLYILRLI